MQKVIKTIIFVLVFCVIWQAVFSVLWLKQNNIAIMYNEPKNSLDVLYFGSSMVHRSYNPTLAYNLYGFTTGIIATGAQPFGSIKYLIDESRKYQNPKLYVIDLTRLQDYVITDFNDKFIRWVTDMMKFNSNRINLINELLGMANVPKKQYINYYFSFLIYHNTWKSIDISNFNYGNFSNYNLYKGYDFYDNILDVEPTEEIVWNDKTIPLPSENKKMLLDLINYTKSNDLNVLFVIPKTFYWSPKQETLNDAVSIIKRNNLKVINFNKVTDLNISNETDFSDKTHFNIYGSTKYTKYLARYLKDNYDLPNHKGDSLYDSWDLEYENFKSDFKKEMGYDFENLLTDN